MRILRSVVLILLLEVFDTQGGRFIVDQQQLGLGLGLLLGDDVKTRASVGENPDEDIASWLNDTDVKAEITEFAALAALQTESYPEPSCTALLYS